MQEHWAGKHPLTLYSFPELNPHRLLVIVHTHLDTHTYSKSQSGTNSHNQLPALMKKDSLSKATPNSSPSIPIVLKVIMMVNNREHQETCIFVCTYINPYICIKLQTLM